MIGRAQLAHLYPRAAAGRLDAVAAAVPAVLPRFGLDRPPHRLAFFLAQLGHESEGMTVGVENMNYSAQRMTEVWKRRFPTLASAEPFANNPEKLGNHVYANRNGNGNAASGDGFRYRGRGLIQLTGRATYAEVGRIVGLDLEGDPPLAARNENLLVIAAGFWAWKKINPCCDADDFRQCTILVNGGTVGMEDRRLWLDKARRILAQVPPRGAQPPAATVIAVQRRLQTLGFTQVGAADGDLGRKTVAAIDAFRTLRGLPVGSVEAPIDAALLTALGLAL